MDEEKEGGGEKQDEERKKFKEKMRQEMESVQVNQVSVTSSHSARPYTGGGSKGVQHQIAFFPDLFS